MQVTSLSVSDGRRTRQCSVQEALELASAGDFSRIAFAGRTKRGRSGIALDVLTGKVTGHKIDPFPPGIRDILWNAPSAREGMKRALKGEDVIIGSDDNGIALKWLGNRIEVFGAGTDSET